MIKYLLGLVFFGILVQGFAAEPITMFHDKIYFISLDSSIDDLFYLNNIRQPTKIQISEGLFSPPYNYVGYQEMPFYRMGKDLPPPFPSEDALKEFKQKNPPATTVDLPPANGEYLIVFAHGASTEYRTVVFDFSVKNFPTGSYLILNTTAKTMKVQMGALTWSIKSGESQLTVPEVADQEVFPVKIFEPVLAGDRMVESGVYMMYKKIRNMILIGDGPPSSHVYVVRVIRDTMFRLPERNPPTPTTRK